MRERDVEFRGGPLDGQWLPAPMLGDAPADLVEVDVPPVFASALDFRSVMPDQTHRYQFVVAYDTGRVMYEHRGAVDTPAHDWRPFLRRSGRTSDDIRAALRAVSNLNDNPITDAMREVAIAKLAADMGTSVDEMRARLHGRLP